MYMYMYIHSHVCTYLLCSFLLLSGNIGGNLTVNPDLYISRDGGVQWEQTLVGSWGVNVADHGGLLVAARDYHQNYSQELMYSCNEGQSWNSFIFANVGPFSLIVGHPFF